MSAKNQVVKIDILNEVIGKYTASDNNVARQLCFDCLNLTYTVGLIQNTKSETSVFSNPHSVYMNLGKTGRLKFTFNNGRDFTTLLKDFSPVRFNTDIYLTEVDCQGSSQHVRKGGGRHKIHMRETSNPELEILYVYSYMVLGLMSGLPYSLENVVRGLLIAYITPRLMSTLAIAKIEYDYRVCLDVSPQVEYASTYAQWVNARLNSGDWAITLPSHSRASGQGVNTKVSTKVKDFKPWE